MQQMLEYEYLLNLPVIPIVKHMDGSQHLLRDVVRFNFAAPDFSIEMFLVILMMMML